MLSCLTDDDAKSLLRKLTQKEFYTRLMPILNALPSTLTEHSIQDQWHSLHGDTHTLSRLLGPDNLPADWAIWSDKASQTPLLMASCSWWEPMLKAAQRVLMMSKHIYPRAIALDNPPLDVAWMLLAAVYMLGVDEIFWIKPSPFTQKNLIPLIASLPVTAHTVQSDTVEEANWSLRCNPDRPSEGMLESSDIEASTWYGFFRFLYRLTEELHVGHRTNWVPSTVDAMSLHSFAELVAY